MNANSIWGGNDYAFIPNRGRSERFSLKAHRIKAWRVTKEQEAGKQNATTFVICDFLDRETGEKIESPVFSSFDYRVIVKLSNGQFKVRAYDLVEHWDNVKMHYRQLAEEKRRQDEERDRLNRERQERYERDERERNEHMRRTAEEHSRKINKLRQFLNNAGITDDMIAHVNPFDIKLNSTVILEVIDTTKHALIEGGTRDTSTI